MMYGGAQQPLSHEIRKSGPNEDTRYEYYDDEIVDDSIASASPENRKYPLQDPHRS
jgi:hypothetical protein